MEPLTTTAIAIAIANGLAELADQLAQKTFLDPVLDPLAETLRGHLSQLRNADERALQQAVESAFAEIGAPQSADRFEEYILNVGFDQLRAEGSSELRREVARAVLTMTEPTVSQIPDDLLQSLRWPSSRRSVLADFLYRLRLEIAAHPDYGALIAYTDREDVRFALRDIRLDTSRTADATERAAHYLQWLLRDRELDPDKPEAQALEEYIDHIRETHSYISFLFVRPVGRRNQLRTEAELETVFVPLHIQDPDLEMRRDRRGERVVLAAEEMAAEREMLPIAEVVQRYPLFLLKGAAGSGKTTLLRHVANCLANGRGTEQLGLSGDPLLPILVPLRNFGRFLSDHRADFTNPAPRALRSFIEDYFAEYELELPPDFFRARLREGRCLVLLDGLDEVADRELRALVAQMVSAFMRHYQKRGNRFGLASRPKGYEEVAHFLPHPVVCTVQPLLPAGRDELVINLLRVLEPDEQKQRADSDALLFDIRSKVKVDELSRNPLFCTTLVLVYKYRGTTLPERRVDVYHELVELLLGFWETHKAEREGIIDVRDLVLVDGTGRPFMDENDAVEAKRRALVDLADWMQHKGLAEVPELRAAARLARFFRLREGASRTEDGVWARNFLAVSHQRSGLFVEVQPGIYAFSHQNFREYMAATALIGRRDDPLIKTVLTHANDPWWEEVILLAAAHPGLSVDRREFLVGSLLDDGFLLLAGRCAVDAGARLPAPLRQRIQRLLHTQMTDTTQPPKERYAAGEVLDELGWLPCDLNAWVCCPDCADDGGDLLMMKYPVTNVQFAHFVESDGYTNPAY